MKKYFLLLLILVLGASLRLWSIGQVPISPDWDEVALGYNAYSIMQTGRDEYGKLLPFVLRSYDDYKPALYAYLAMPFIKIFGLEVFSVRLPSVIFGILTLLVTYLLLKNLFPNAKKYSLFGYEISVAEVATFLLAISPWHIQFSRVAFETNVGLGLNILAAFFFLKGLKKGWNLCFASLFLSLSIYTYQGEKVFVPLLSLSLVVIFRKQLFALQKKYLVTAFLVGIILILPMVTIILTDRAVLSRAQGTSFLSEKTPILQTDIKKLMRDYSSNDKLGILFNNRRIVYAKTVLRGYLSHFDLNWLFIKGDYGVARHHAPNMGLLYLWELPFLLTGIYALVFGNFNKTTKLLILAWFIIAPIPASVTTGVPHPVRTLNFLPIFQVFTALGILATVEAVKNSRIKYLFFSFFLIVFTFNFLYYLNQYFVQQNYYTSKDWQYGYKELIEYLNPIRGKYNKIIVSNDYELSQSYMFFLFYLKYNPSAYLASEGTTSGGFSETNKFLNFEFRKFEYYRENEKNILLIGGPSDFQEEFNVIHTILYKDNSVAIKIVEKK